MLILFLFLIFFSRQWPWLCWCSSQLATFTSLASSAIASCTILVIILAYQVQLCVWVSRKCVSDHPGFFLLICFCNLKARTSWPQWWLAHCWSRARTLCATSCCCCRWSTLCSTLRTRSGASTRRDSDALNDTSGRRVCVSFSSSTNSMCF